MKHSPAFRCAVLAIVGALVSAAGHAATAGRPQGAVLIGRPLEVTVPLVLEGAGDPAPECAEAEVFYGDSKVPPGNVSTELQAGPHGPSVRVRSGAAVNEPVVTVYLQLGCGSRFTRRLVLLSEPDPAVDAQRPFPTEAPAASRSKVAEAAANVAPLNLALSRDRPASVAPAATPVQPVRRRRVPATSPQLATKTVRQAGPLASAAAPKPTASAAVVAQAIPAARDQLKLDAVPVGVAEPAAPSEEALRQAARLQGIERDLREMRQFLQRNDAAMLQLQAQLARAESQRYANPLVYGLVGLLLVMAGLMAWLWRRVTTAREASLDDWWHSPRVDKQSVRPATVGDEVQHGIAGRPGSSMTFGAGDHPGSAQVAAGEPPLPPTVRVPLTSVTARTDDFQSSQTGSRALKAEELHDVQQEADFFSSLGEYDRAIDVLRSHIQAHPETSAVAWLDLVEIYHKLGRRDEFDWVRREFQHRFNAQVPAFDEYSQESAGIEAYDNAMARIAALWPSRRVLDVIEESIFRGPTKDGARAFSLQAYRELLLLHHIGQQVLVGASSPQPSQFGDSGPASGPTSEFSSNGFSHTSIHPLSTGIASLDHSPGGDHVLDFNLDEPQEQAAPEAQPYMLDFDLPDPPASAHGTITRVSR